MIFTTRSPNNGDPTDRFDAMITMDPQPISAWGTLSRAIRRHLGGLTLAAGLSLLVALTGCDSQETQGRKTVVSLQDRHVVGALNALDLNQARRLIRDLQASLPDATWDTAEDCVPLDLTDLLPTSVGAWRINEEPRSYRGKQLAEYVVDSALFQDYGFVEMVGSSYYERYQGEDPLLQVDLYRMDSPLDAFGIYSLQRNVQARPERIGTEAILTDESLDAWENCYYLKIQAWGIADVISEGMVQIAQAVFSQIESESALPQVLDLLPAEGKLRATGRLFHTYRALDQITLVPPVNVLQLDRETNGLLGEYRNKGSELEIDTLVLYGIEYPSSEEASAAFEFYRAYMNQQDTVKGAGLGAMSFVVTQGMD